MKIVCLGWGSLIWDPRVLRCKGAWHEDGPHLPLEFARTSADGRLTLVLLQSASSLPSLWVELDYATAAQAQEALAGREACGLRWIGLWTAKGSTEGAGTLAIGAWARSRGFDAVVWTALPPKFNRIEGQGPRSAEEAVTYLQGLDVSGFSRAHEYVERAPAQVRTSFRSHIEKAFGLQTR